MRSFPRSSTTLLSAFLSLASIGTSATTCAINNGYVDPPDRESTEAARFCYQSLGEISCYAAPQSHLGPVVALEPERPKTATPATTPSSRKFGDATPTADKPYTPATPAPVNKYTISDEDLDDLPPAYKPSQSPDPLAKYSSDKAKPTSSGPIPITPTGR